MQKIDSRDFTGSIQSPPSEGMRDRFDTLYAQDHPRFCGDEDCELCAHAHSDANPHCLICKGTGWVHPIIGHLARPDFSRVLPCNAPGCHQETIRARKESEQFDKRTGTSRMQLLNNFYPVKGAAGAYEAAKALTEDGTVPFLLIYGNVGCGKTHLCNAVALELAQGGKKVFFRRADDLLEYLREGIDEHALRSRIVEFQVVDVLVIDDFESAKLQGEKGSWGLEKMEQIIDHRYHVGLLTMITTNDDYSELPPRIKDRFNDKAIAKMVHNAAPSFRPLKKRKFTKRG
jgi:DNA replication protein DnaC